MTTDADEKQEREKDEHFAKVLEVATPYPGAEIWEIRDPPNFFYRDAFGDTVVLLTKGNNRRLFFVDCFPEANWAHPCIHVAVTDQEVVCHHGTAPPEEYIDMDLLYSGTGSDPQLKDLLGGELHVEPIIPTNFHRSVVLVDKDSLAKINGYLTGDLQSDLPEGRNILAIDLRPDDLYYVFLHLKSGGPGERAYIDASLWKATSPDTVQRVNIGIPSPTNFDDLYTFEDAEEENRHYWVRVKEDPEPDSTPDDKGCIRWCSIQPPPRLRIRYEPPDE